MRRTYTQFNELVGQTIVSIVEDDDWISIKTEQGNTYGMGHEQD